MTVGVALNASIANQIKVYGDPDPPLSASAVTLAPVKRTVKTWGGDVPVDDTHKVSATVTGLVRSPGEHVGIYLYTGVTLSSLSGSAAPNYANRAMLANHATLTITPRALTVIAVPDIKRFDGTVRSGATPMVKGLHGADRALATQTFDTANAGSDKILTPSVEIDDGNGGANYLVTLIVNRGGRIIARGR